jgi:hypothetical protein
MRYRSTREGDVLLDFVCKSCGCEARARVRSEGEGEARATLFIGMSTAKERASAESQRNLESNAQVVLAMARCPQCKHVDKAAIDSARMGAILKSLGLAFAALVLFQLTVGRHGTPSSWPIPLAAIAAVVLYVRARWQWTEVEQRVEFVGKPHKRVEREKPARAAEEMPPWRVGLVWGAAAEEAKLTWPFVNGLRLGLLLAEPDGLAWAEPRQLECLRESEARGAALKNLERGEGLSELERGVLRGQWGDGLAASRLATPAMFRDLDVRGKPVAFTASEDTLVIAGSEDAEALARAFALSKKHLAKVRKDEASSAGTFTAHPWILTDAGWRPWELPDGHPLRGEVAALQATLGAHAWRPA